MRLSPCLKKENKNELCDDYGTPHKTPQIFSSGKFCLVSVGKNGVFQSHFFAAALGSGCIPVVVAKNIILPFEPRIDWPSLSVKIFPEDVDTGNFVNKKFLGSVNKKFSSFQNRIFFKKNSFIFLLCNSIYQYIF